jgi:hypothetical protein
MGRCSCRRWGRVIVVEQLVSPQSLYTAYLRATRERPRPYLDHVWMVATGNIYCFDGPAALLEGGNRPVKVVWHG